MRLHINSGTHTATNVSKRVSESEDHVKDPGAVFIEESESPRSLSKFVRSLILAPLLVGVMIVWVFVVLPVLRPFLGDDRQIEEQIAEKYDALLIPVDAPKLDLIWDEWRLWGLANWLLITSTPYLHNGSLLDLVQLLFIQGVALFVAYLTGVHQIRNRHIAERIAENANSFSEGVFVTGKKHHEPVAEFLSDYDRVVVLNPTVDE